MKKKFMKYAGIIAMLLFLAAFIPSALSPAEGTAGSEVAASAGTHAAGTGPVGPNKGEMAFPGPGVGTIAVGTAIAEAAVIAVAASQSTSSNSTTIH